MILDHDSTDKGSNQPALSLGFKKRKNKKPKKISVIHFDDDQDDGLTVIVPQKIRPNKNVGTSVADKVEPLYSVGELKKSQRQKQEEANEDKIPETIKVYDDSTVHKIKQKKLLMRLKLQESQEKQRILNEDEIDVDLSSDEELNFESIVETKEEESLEGQLKFDHNLELLNDQNDIKDALYEYHQSSQDEELREWEKSLIYHAIKGSSTGENAEILDDLKTNPVQDSFTKFPKLASYKYFRFDEITNILNDLDTELAQESEDKKDQLNEYDYDYGDEQDKCEALKETIGELMSKLNLQ